MTGIEFAIVACAIWRKWIPVGIFLVVGVLTKESFFFLNLALFVALIVKGFIKYPVPFPYCSGAAAGWYDPDREPPKLVQIPFVRYGRECWLPALYLLPAFLTFIILHLNTNGWWSYYASFIPAELGVPRNDWLFRVKEVGGWGPFWREAWAAFGVLWLLSLIAWPRVPLFWRIVFVVVWLGCFAACMVSMDKMRLWYRMAPVMTVFMLYLVKPAEYIIAHDKALPNDQT